jgi:hypothetical protein
MLVIEGSERAHTATNCDNSGCKKEDGSKWIFLEDCGVFFL